MLSIIQTTNFLLLFFCFCVEKKSVKLVRHDFWIVANSLLFLDYSQVSNKRECSFFDFGVFALSACTFLCKVHIFWEGHKILRNLHPTFDYSTYSQNKGKISQNFEAFSEYMNCIISELFDRNDTNLILVQFLSKKTLNSAFVLIFYYSQIYSRKYWNL